MNRFDNQLRRNDLPDSLFNKANMVEPSPQTVAPVLKMADSTAFFPGGRGLWLDDNSDIFPDILVLGHDFSTEDWYNEMIAGKEKDLDSPTWKNMIAIFQQANIDLNRCFFSNVFMGLRRTAPMVGEFPGFKDKPFVQRNTSFLLCQILTIAPRIIITLGKYAAELLAQLSPIDLSAWRDWQALKTPDAGLALEVCFDSHVCTCVALEHPSMRNSNVK